jgi:hypothetical protein
MSEREFDSRLEARVRAELRRAIVPPPTPDHVRDRIDRMAEEAIAAPGSGSRRFLAGFPIGRAIGRPRGFRLNGLAAAAAIAAIVSVALFGWDALNWHPPIAAPTPSPTPGTSMPAGPGLTGVVSVTPDGAAFVWVQSDDALRVTTDRGVTWSESRRLPPSDNPLYDMGSLDFVDADHGWTTRVIDDAQGSQLLVYRTQNGGRSWQAVAAGALPPDASEPADAGSQVLSQDHFRDASHGQVVVARVSNGQMTACRRYTTDDGGVSWSGPTGGPCIGVVPEPLWTNDGLGYAVLRDAPTSLSVTQDGGRTWRTGSLLGIPPSVSIIPELLVADGAGGLTLVTTVNSYRPAPPAPYGGSQPHLVYGSSDGGATWSREYEISTPSGFASIGWISSLGPQHWVAVVAANPVAPAPNPGGTGQTAEPGQQYDDNRLFETTDAGRTWSIVEGAGLKGAGGLYWWDAGHGLIMAAQQSCSDAGVSCRSSSTVFVTDDAGRTWHQVPF